MSSIRVDEIHILLANFDIGDRNRKRSEQCERERSLSPDHVICVIAQTHILLANFLSLGYKSPSVRLVCDLSVSLQTNQASHAGVAEFGRRARLRILWEKSCPGSSPGPGTTLKPLEIGCLYNYHTVVNNMVFTDLIRQSALCVVQQSRLICIL